MAALGMHQGGMRNGVGQGQRFGGNFLSNQTLIAAAAQTLGVSVSDLTNALTPPAQGHFNLTNAAAQLSATSGITVTPAQLMAALGMHQGGMRNSTQWKQGGSFRSHHAGFGNRTASHSWIPPRGRAPEHHKQVSKPHRWHIKSSSTHEKLVDARGVPAGSSR